MPEAAVNGVRLAYEVKGSGQPVLMIMGTGARARVWHVHQVPALVAAGYSVTTFDCRGVPPSDVPPGVYSIGQLVADAGSLIDHLRIGPCRVVGLSLGATIAQELALARPDAVRALVLIATEGRLDSARRALLRADTLLNEERARLPAEYEAVVRAFQMLSPHTLNSEKDASLWLETFALPHENDGLEHRLRLEERPNRLSALRGVRAPTMVIGFADDLIAPPHLGREVAEAIQGSEYIELKDCGHLGHLERPDAVNAELLRFLHRV